MNEAQVNAIKSLVAHSMANLTKDDVAVIDSKTGQELMGTDSSSSGSSTTNTTALECEQLYQKKLEQNVKKLLQSRYGSTGVVASAKVTLDFDKMMQEKKDLTRATDGKDAVKHKENTYTVNGAQTAASGIAGEESNTDVPVYKNSTSPTASGGTTQYTEKQDIDFGYIKTQIEKGQPEIKSASISVMVNDANLAANKADLVNAVAKATQIGADNISVMAINPNATPTTPTTPAQNAPLTTQQILLLLAIAAALFIIIVVALVFRSKRRAKIEAAQMVAQAEDQAADTADKMRSELEAYKQQLEDNARAKVNEKDQVAADEVRNFAKENPQITADLLRSWLKEDGQ